MPRMRCMWLVLLTLGSPTLGTAQISAPTDSYQVIHTYPHDPHAFTQGLIYVYGHLY